MPKRNDKTPTINFPVIKWEVGDTCFHVINRNNFDPKKGTNHFKCSFVPGTIVLLKNKGAIVQFFNGIKKFCEFQLLTKEVPLDSLEIAGTIQVTQ
jgi:hypothetical protein